ncbi:uncharacterized protein LOC129790043 [Lutzomyia longipalpis]|uniref:uncharacterized protein LOC129790043 n=1 Tax=Lutzomyia longipalpis TaxID=7200 RepID=UPI002483AD0B|nr:uncharacterized protein LOC129790043 [Lutzomyia longipalpis]
MNHPNFDAKSKPIADSRSSSSSTSSGFSLFRWFRRNERVRPKVNPLSEPQENNRQKFDSSETLSPPESPNLSRGYRSQSSSCDSILSTETTGFAFVPATTSYHNGTLSENQLPKGSGSDLDTFRRRILEQKRNRQVELNLTKKYGLYATDTLKSVREDAERLEYSDLSLPTPDVPLRSHRRTHSESVLKGKAPRVHVKGKRKAPQPPNVGEKNQNHLQIHETVSPASTLGRKKRRAPQPPEVVENAPKSILDGGLLDDKEIQAIIGGGPARDCGSTMDRIRVPVVEEIKEDVLANDTLKLEKGVLKPIKPTEVKEEAKIATPSSPISPRPWYKRPLSGNRDTSIPFKKEVILRTVDKRRREPKEKENDALPEVNYSRNSSLFDSSKFGLFSRHHTREETKRRSGIGIPNISELDREAAEIVKQEKESRGLSPPQALILRPQMFASPQSSLDDDDEDGPRKSTKELISKFEASSNGARITLNTSFIGRTDNFVDSRTRVSANEETINKVDGLNSPMAQKRRIFSDTQSPPNSPAKVVNQENPKESSQQGKDDKEGLKPIGIWTCPYCTLENPNWRILCEACERIKPYDKRLVNLMEPETKPNHQARQQFIKKPSSPKDNWERKAEIVKRYFNPSQGGNALAKSASETSIGMPVKRNSPSRLIGSPKFTFRGLIQRSSPEKVEIEKGIDEEDSDVENFEVLTKGRDGTPDIEELRQVRLNRFKIEKAVNPLTDRDSLEKEKKRLREMIRAMNAKALAEKYPVIQKAASLDEASSPSKGAIKKTYPKTDHSPDEIKKETEKSTKVSTSAQTGAIVKKTSSPEKEEQSNGKEKSIPEPIYANLNCQVNHVKFSEVEKAKVEELTEQLKSVKGREEFKATLKFSELTGNTNTLAINKIMKSLEMAIVEGQHELAATLAKDLAKMKVSLSVTRQKTRPLSITDIDMKPFMIDLYVEDKVAHKGPLQISVTSQMTLKDLKEKVSKDFSIPIDVQRWILNDQLATDENKQLIDFSIRDSSATVYLYLVTPPARKPSHKDPMKYFLAEEDQFSICGSDEEIQNEKVIAEDAVEDVGAIALVVDKEKTDTLEKGWPCPLCTLINSPTRLGCGVCSEARPLDYILPQGYQKVEKPQEEEVKEKVENVVLRPLERKNDLNRVNPNRKSAELFNIVQEEIRFKTPGLQIPSPNITKNKYRGVYNYNPKTKYTQISSQCSQVTPKEPKKLAPQPPSLHKELLSLDNAELVANIEPFECPICFMKFQPGEGAILRDCLHTFCRECLGHTVEYCEDAEVKCPFMDAVYSCDSVLQDREIKAVVTREVYEKYLAKSVRQAENKIENAFHCKTPNCRGWCIYEDNVNLFKCPVCKITNCLTCQVIHDGLNCKQYQDRMNSDCDSNAEARSTKMMLETMVDKGEAMKCPTCQVILMKKWGCDWLKCSMCKTEICWVTRGPRWGPAGKGDTSAGCKCGVDSKKCHPQCNYCH